MPGPRHLWSGDWRRESAAAAEERAGRHAPTETPSAKAPPSPPKPSTPSAAARALALLGSLRRHGAVLTARALTLVRSLRPRGAVLTAVAMLISAGVAFAAVSLVRSGGGGSSQNRNAAVASSPVRTTAPAWLGVETIQFPSANGAVVADVVPGSPADVAGLQPGDVITQIGNRPVQTPTDLESALAGMHPGQQVEIQYELGPSSYTTRVKLAARPANGP
jgi:hypothetical protein